MKRIPSNRGILGEWIQHENAQEAIEEFHIRPIKKKRRTRWRHHLSFSGAESHIKCITSSCKWNKGLKNSKMLQPHFGQVWGWSPTLGKVGGLESSGTPECSELNSKAQNTSHWGVLGVIGKVLKLRYRKWPRIGNLNICSPSYGQKKGRESNWQFDSRPLKVVNRPLPDVALKSATRHWKALDESYNIDSQLVPIRVWGEELWPFKVPGVQLGHFRDSILGVPTRCAIRM
jgi:hypothetical protein